MACKRRRDMKCEICGAPAGYLVNDAIGLCEDCMYAAGDDLEPCEVVELDYDDDESDEEDA